MDNIWLIATIWIGLALVASLISIRVGISVALVEIVLGVLAGNFFHIQTNDWINFLATFGSVLLTFLAGAEIDPASLRTHLKPSLVIGTVAFALPFLGVFAVAYWGIGWTLQSAEIAGIALSTTSVAVVYAVMIDTGLNNTELGKLILAACFVNDLGTVLALGVLFADFNGWLVVFVVVTALVLWRLPWLTRWVIAHLPNRASEPEIKFLFLVLCFLGWLATAAKSEAVLPAYLVGLVVAGVFVTDKVLVHRMRAIAFALLTPFYFIKAGLYVTLPALVAGAGLIVLFLALKMATKFVGVWPLTRAFRMPTRVGNYTTLLMSTGLTFGTISALYGLTNQLITQDQYTILVTVVIGSALIPTFLAQTFFQPGTADTTLGAPSLERQAPEALPGGAPGATRESVPGALRAEPPAPAEAVASRYADVP